MHVSNRILPQPKCCVCTSSVDCDTNRLLKCRKCNTIVHQSCYTNSSTPFGWMCDVCSSGAHPETTICELCPFKGGAYKNTDTDKWVHCLCALWVPEITTKPDRLHGLVYNISKIDKDRYKLKCMECKLTKCGVCIQCSYGRCTAPIHPHCAITGGKGFAHRIFKHEDYTVAEVFCAKHADSVKDPYKPKAKPAAIVEDLGEEEEYDTSPRGGRRKSNEESSRSASKLTMAHAFKFDPKRVLDVGASDLVETGKKVADLIIKDENATESDGDNGEGLINKKTANNKSSSGSAAKGGKHASSSSSGRSKGAFGTKGSTSSSGQGNEKLTIPTMSEWPGQAEGEAMDLEHFWNVVSLHFPSTYSPEWIEIMQEVFTSDDFFECDSDDELLQMPPTSDKRDEIAAVSAQFDEIWSSLSEKSRHGMVDIDKRCQSLAQIRESIEVIGGHKVPAAVSLSRNGSRSDNADSYDTTTADSQLCNSHLAADKTPSDVYFLDDLDYMTQKIHSFSRVDCVPSDSGINTIMCIFDGDCSRFAVEMKVVLEDSSGNSEHIRRAEKSVAAWSQVSLKNYNKDAHRELVAASLISRLVTAVVDDAPLVADSVWMGISSINAIDSKLPVHVGDRTIIPKGDDDIFSRMIRTDQAAYKRLSRAIRSKVSHLMAYDFKADSARMIADRTEWASQELIYNNQKVWKNIVSTVVRGMRDQQADFNKASTEEMELPASWAIRVEGRPAPPSYDEDDKDKAAEDIICMCCFDGSISDTNQILFCDGCNSAVHQTCYGVSEIPDGDFFCERCRGVQAAVDDLPVSDKLPPSAIKDMIKCCLCPHHHGGLKATTDGRWVHVCCVLWSETAVIRDMAEMGPVDLSNVAVQLPAEDAAFRAIPAALQLGISSVPLEPIKEACTFCGLLGGLVRRCGADAKCPIVFHPLCAWFHGLHVESVVSDSAFLGRERGGLYPSGVSYTFCCDAHCPPEFQGQVREDQISLRTKYRIPESDLEAVPGQNKRKRLKKASKDKEGGRLTGRLHVKDLPPDPYDHRKCAICLSQFSDLDKVAEAKKEVVEIKDDDVAAKGATAADAVPPTLLSSAPPARKVLSCNICKISVHSSCCDDTNTYYSPSDPLWTCEACCKQESDLTCMFCPRKGGCFKATTSGDWAHVYCARNAPGVVKITSEGLIDSRAIPKDSRKQKCVVCNRRNGVCMKCSFLGCQNGYFHPICGVRTGKICIFARMGVVNAMCPEHAHNQFKKHEIEGWYDDFELDMVISHLGALSTLLDKLRLREKKKRDLNLCEKDLFNFRFSKELDKVMGRKFDGVECDLDDSYLLCSDDDDDSDDYDDYDDLFSDDENPRLMLKQIYCDKWVPVEGDSILVATTDNVEMEVSASFAKNGDVKLPKKISTSVCGVKRERKHAAVFPSQKLFTKAYLEEQKKYIHYYPVFSLHPPYDLPKDCALCVKEILKLYNIPDDAKFEKEMRKRGLEVDLSKVTTRAKRGAVGDGDHAPIVKKAAKEAPQQESPKRRGRPAKTAISSTSQKASSRRDFDVLDEDNGEEEEWEEEVVVKVDKRKRKTLDTAIEEQPEMIAPLTKKKGYVVEVEKQAVAQQRTPYYGRSELLQRMSMTARIVADMDLKYSFDDTLYSRTLITHAEFLDPADLEHFSPERLPELERRIFDIMLEVEEARMDENTLQLIPSAAVSATHAVSADPGEEAELGLEARKSSRGRPPKSRALLADSDVDEPGVQLIGDFLELPYKTLPHYNKYVRRLLTFNELSRRYKSHRYSTMCSFVKDFYDMLNNGRNVTSEHSTTYRETALIVQLFEDAKRRSANPVKRTDTKYAGANVESTKLDAKVAKLYADTLNPNLKCCLICKNSFDVQNLPDANSDINWNPKRPARCRFGWACPECICRHADSGHLMNRRIAVFWSRDQCFYGGVVDFYDVASQRHRVCYDDGEWAFEDLSVEPNAFEV